MDTNPIADNPLFGGATKLVVFLAATKENTPILATYTAEVTTNTVEVITFGLNITTSQV